MTSTPILADQFVAWLEGLKGEPTALKVMSWMMDHDPNGHGALVPDGAGICFTFTDGSKAFVTTNGKTQRPN